MVPDPERIDDHVRADERLAKLGAIETLEFPVSDHPGPIERFEGRIDGWRAFGLGAGRHMDHLRYLRFSRTMV